MSVAVAGASEALKKVRELQAEGFATIIFDDAGRERSIDEMQVRARAPDVAPAPTVP